MTIENNELYASLWTGYSELRGGMYASQYKGYMLTLPFMKHISDEDTEILYSIIEIPKVGDYFPSYGYTYFFQKLSIAG
jgi:type I restriction-modification system DNA methylase subunit